MFRVRKTRNVEKGWFGAIPVSSPMVFSSHCPWHSVLSPKDGATSTHPSSCAQIPSGPDTALLHGALLSPDLLQPELWNEHRNAALVPRGKAGVLILGYLKVEAPRSREV